MNNQYLRLLGFFIINDSVTMQELVATEHVSERTMSKYLQQLNQELSGAATIQEKAHRYYLKVNNYQRLAELQMGHLKRQLDFNDVNKRYAFILQKLFRSSNYITLDDLASELMVSKATLNRDLKQLRNRLKPYYAEIDSMTNNGIRLIVKRDYEVPIIVQQFVYDYFDFQSELTTLQNENLKRVFDKLEIDSVTSRLIIKNILALQFAIKNGYRIKNAIPNFNRLWQRNSIINSLLWSLAQCFDVDLNQWEIDYILAPLTYKASSLLSIDIVEKQLKVNQSLFLKMAQTSDLKNVINFNHLYEQIKYHFLFLINRTIFHAQVTQLLPGNLLTKYPLAYDLAQLLLQMVDTFWKLKIDESEFGYLVLYFEMELEDGRAQQNNQFEVAIVGQVSSSLIRFVRHQLSEVFNDEVVVTSFANAKQLNHSLGHYLIIFSDQPIKYHDVSTPVVRISTAFRADTLRGKLQVSLVEKAIVEHNCQFDFWSFKHTVDYLNAVETMIRAKIHEGSLDKSFVKAWRERESNGASVFENGIAMPHVIDQSDKQRILLQIGVFDRPIKYQDRNVQIIFLIGIPQNLNQALNRNLSQIYDLIFLISSNKNIYQNLLNYDRNQGLMQITEGI